MGLKKIKCVVWDLDNTVWDGVLIEDPYVRVNDDAVKVIKELDKRGVLQSVASKNNYDHAKEQLISFGLWDYFIYPQIHWNPKSGSVSQIAKDINIGLDTFAFVDDQMFERDEVNHSLNNILCIDAKDIPGMLAMERLIPMHITQDSKNRRKMYQDDIVRNDIENTFIGTKEEFLRTLGMKFTIQQAKEEDLQRAEELTVRTHQLNSTGYMYDYEELKAFCESDRHEVLVAGLSDKYGDFGKIGLALLERDKDCCWLKLLLMSCRVISKGVGNVFLNYIINRAIKQDVELKAQFVPTDKNKMMYITFKFNGFKEISQEQGVVILSADMSYERPIPDYVELKEG